jgi:peptide/nickel transport system substrate-binding protein
MTDTPIRDKQRDLKLRQIMNMGGSRRDMLKAAAAAGLIPVLTSAQAASAAAAAQDGGTPVRGGTFITLGHQTVDTLSPESSGATVVWVALAQLFDSLYIVDEQYQLVPVLAESYEPSADGLTYTFKLRTGVKFHNSGAAAAAASPAADASATPAVAANPNELTSADVKYTFDWIMDPANGSTRAGNFELVESVEAPDPTTVIVRLTKADVTFMVNVATTMIYPAVYHAQVGEEAFTAAPIGTGPFYLADPGDFTPAQRVTLTAFEEYFRGRANFDTFQLDVVPEAAGRMTALESGAADNSIWTLNAEDSITIEESGDFKTFKTLNNAVNHFPLNNKHPFLSDMNVRKALMHATDRQVLLDEVYQGLGVLATSHLSPNVEKFYNPNVTTYDFNPDTAKQMLTDSGWVEAGDVREKDGVKAQFTLQVIQGDSQRRPIAEINQQFYKDVGVQMDLVEAQVADILAALPKGEMDAALFNWVYGGNSGEPDARDTLKTGQPNNFSSYSNAEVDELLDLGITQLNEEERIATYNRIQEIVAEEVPFLFFLHPQGYAFYRNNISGLPESVLSSDNLYLKLYLLWKNPE